MENGVKASDNGAAGAPAAAEPNGSDETMRRAEELADRLIERVGTYTAWLGRAVLTLAAQAREEAADIWAEAEHLSRKGKS
jgi:hypothetical protein